MANVDWPHAFQGSVVSMVGAILLILGLTGNSFGRPAWILDVIGAAALAGGLLILWFLARRPAATT